MIPLLDQLFQVGGDVLLKLGDRLGAEGMGDGLAFARMFRSISGAEQVAGDGDEGFVVVAVSRMDRSVIY